MKAIKHSALALLVGSLLLVSCKKENTAPLPTPAYPMEGMWQGKYGFDNDTPSLTYIFNIKQNGIIQELDSTGKVLGNGTWALNGTNFNTRYEWGSPFYFIFNASATLDKLTGKLSGTWGYENSDTDGGKWTMTKKR